MMNLIDNYKIINSETDTSIILLHSYGKTKKRKKDGNLKDTKCNKKEDESSEVFAFNTEEKIKSMMEVFNKHIAESRANTMEKRARRNKLVFLVGINIGIRAGDLIKLKWNFFIESLNSDGTVEKFKEYYDLKPEKQKKQNKFVRLHFNETVRRAINEYVKNFPITNLEDYIFFATDNSNEHISYHALYEMLKKTAKEAGIKENIGTHSLRKTWGFWCWHKAMDKSKALTILQKCFNHSSVETTLKYIGLLDSEIKEMYNSIELGMEYI